LWHISFLVTASELKINSASFEFFTCHGIQFSDMVFMMMIVATIAIRLANMFRTVKIVYMKFTEFPDDELSSIHYICRM
jgi:hypothetical protein